MKVLALLCAAAIAFTVYAVHAASLTYVSDLISTSGPGLSASHTIQFTATQAIPASGYIVITPPSGSFNIPTGFGTEDVDLSVSSGGPYADRSLATTSSATHDGVAAVAGLAGSITITLNSTSGIVAGEAVRVELGSVATYEASGADNIPNPSVGSYRISIVTKNASNAIIDRANAMVAIVDQVTMGSLAPIVAPVRLNGLPSGEIAAGNDAIEISLETADDSTCRYATSTGVSYASMTGSFTPSLGTLFYTVITGHQNETTYNYYVRCSSVSGGANDDDYAITFNLKETPSSDTSIPGIGTPSTNGVSGYLGPGGVGSYPGGSAVLYLASITITGWTSPSANVVVLKDGAAGTTARSASDGSFTATLSDMERGTYTFQIYSEDGQRRKSATYSATLSLTSGTENTVTNVVIAPTIALSSQSAATGEEVKVSGAAVPASPIEITLYLQASGTPQTEPQIFRATSSALGVWEYSLGNALKKGTYFVDARVLNKKGAHSDYSTLLSFSVGSVGQVGPSDVGTRTDINSDSKVNLVDFSILLSNWGGDDAGSDINEDGVINLADFSILLFYWTG